MSGKTVTRADLYQAIYQKIGLSRTECTTLVELVLKEITDCLERGGGAPAVLPHDRCRTSRLRAGGVVHFAAGLLGRTRGWQFTLA
jgi:Bacterial DNA-binding protein